MGELASTFRRRIGGWGSNAEPSLRFVHAFFRELRQTLAAEGVTDEDVLTSFHQFLEDLLVERLVQRIGEWKGGDPGTCATWVAAR